MKNKTFKRIYEMLKPNAKAILIIIILSIFINIGEVVKPYLIKVVLDDYLTAGLYQKGILTIGMIGAIYIFIVLVGNILNFIVTTSTNMMGENVIYSIRNKLYKYIEHANMSFHEKNKAGALFVRITNDVEDISTLFKEVISTLPKDIIMLAIFLTMMMVLDFKLALLAFLVLPIVVLSSFVIAYINKKAEIKSKKIKTKLNTFLAESIYGVKLIKIFNRQREKQKECEKLCDDYYKSRVKIFFTAGLLPGIILILENLAISIIVWAVVYHVAGYNLEVGVLYMFITYMKQVFDPINRLIDNLETIQEATVSIDKVYEILDHKEYLENFEVGKEIENVKGKIEFKNVWFAYEPENWILKDVSFTIEPGESIALVGKTGSRKNHNFEFDKSLP